MVNSEFKDNKAYLYAKWVMEAGDAEKKPGKYVKKQCKKWLKIAEGKDKKAYFDVAHFNKICRILKLMIHPDLGGTLYDTLEDYAWLLLAAGLCTRDKKTKRRFYQTIILEIARKNFKTFNSAVIFIILMLTEPEFSRFFSVAPDLKLSSELKNAIRKIIKKSPALVEEFQIKVSQIICKITEAEYTPLAYSQDRMDGKLANAYLADEAGALDAYPVEAMRSSQITLPEKLGIIISTQYPNNMNVFADEVDIAKRTLDDMENGDETYFALLYEPDEEIQADWQTDNRVIYQANPVAVKNQIVFDSLIKQRARAILYVNKRENFLCKHCNIKYKGLGTEAYVDIEKLKKCKTKLDMEWWRGRNVWLGLDLSQTDDNTSVAMVTVDNGEIYAYSMAFIPTDRIELKTDVERVDYSRMIEEGYCIACGDEVIGYGEIEDWIKSIPERFGVKVMQVGYDRYNAISTVQKLEDAGMECVEIKQHSSVLHPATKWLREEILQGIFKYFENPLLEINFQNARCVEDNNLNKYVNKKRSNGKVDMVVSVINACHLAMQNVLYGTGFICQM